PSGRHHTVPGPAAIAPARHPRSRTPAQLVPSSHSPAERIPFMASPRIRRLPAVVLATAGLLAAGHIGATLAYTGPETPLRASLQPALNEYFLGPLDQGWNLFAPGPYSQDEYMVVRACISEFDVCAGGTDAGAEFTPWRNITAEEVEAVEYNIF